MFVDVIGADAPDRPARSLPTPLLACVLADVRMERTTVDLDQHLRSPAQVALLTGDAGVQPREHVTGRVKDLKRADLGSAPCALDREACVARDDGEQSTCATSSPMATEVVGDRLNGGQL